MKIPPQRAPAGFTLMEVMLASGLMTVLVLMLSHTVTNLGRAAVDTSTRCRVTQESLLAMQSLARDLGGSLPGQITGSKRAGRLASMRAVRDPQLWLCFDGEPLNGNADWADPDTVIRYERRDGRLLRTDRQAGTTVVVADTLDDMHVKKRADSVVIELTFRHRDLTRTYTIVARVP